MNQNKLSKTGFFVGLFSVIVTIILIFIAFFVAALPLCIVSIVALGVALVGTALNTSALSSYDGKKYWSVIAISTLVLTFILIFVALFVAALPLCIISEIILLFSIAGIVASLNEVDKINNGDNDVVNSEETVKTKQTKNKPRFCENCGAKLSSTSKFCPECGHKIN